MTPQERAARLYAGGSTTAQVAEQLGVDASTVRRWLRAAGVPLRPPGRRRRLDVAAVVAARQAGASWEQVAAQVGASKTGVRTAYQRAAGDRGQLPPRLLTAAQRRRLLRLWQARPEVPGPTTTGGTWGRLTAGEGGPALRAALREHHAAGVTWAYLGQVLGLSRSRTRVIAGG